MEDTGNQPGSVVTSDVRDYSSPFEATRTVFCRTQKVPVDWALIGGSFRVY